MRDYDYLVLGAGWGGLAAASLLARQGKRVAVLEAQDRAGGCGHSFTRDGFSFCAEMQYLMCCGPGGVVHDWLTALGLENEIEFNELDPDGYDRIDLPGFQFRIAKDAHRVQQDLGKHFPDEREKIDALFAILFRIEEELAGDVFDAKRFLRHPFHFKDTVLYGPWPVERVFDHFDLSRRLRAVLAGQCGDIGLSPRDEPLLCLQAVLFGYCQSAHFPRKGMGYFVERIVDFIRQNGGDVYFQTPVTAIERDGDRATGVVTANERFTAPVVISNLDPAVTLAMVPGGIIPDYESSASCFTIFLGLDIDLGAQGFGRFNIWSYPDDDLDVVLDRTLRQHDYDDPFFFLSTPSLYTDPGVLAPVGSTTVQINVGSDFEYFDSARREGRHATETERVARKILDAVERRLIPRLSEHIVTREIWSPVDLANKVGLPRGGMYGARLDFVNRVLKRVSQRTELKNLFLSGATAGGPGLQGVVAASVRLVERLLAPSPSTP